jgi:hypothetical protein
MFIEAFFTIAKVCKPPQQPSAGEWKIRLPSLKKEGKGAVSMAQVAHCFVNLRS